MSTISYNQLLEESEEYFGSVFSITRNISFRSYRESMSNKYDYRSWKAVSTLLYIGIFVGGVILVGPIALFIDKLLAYMGVSYYLDLGIFIVLTSAIAFCSFRYLFWPYSYALFLRWGLISKKVN